MTDVDAGIEVLFVVDDPDVAESTTDRLEDEYGAVTATVATGVDAVLDRLAEDEVDCVVSSHTAETDGLSVLRAVRDSAPDVPFVLFTDEGSEELASEAVRAGVTDYLPMTNGPEGYELLANRVRDAIERVRSRISYREVFDKANIGLTIRDIETGELLDVNRRYCEMLGYSRDEALELSLADITADVPGYTAERAREELRTGIDRGRHTFEWPDRTKAGELLWVEISLAVAEIGGRDRVLVTVRDITERKEREERFRTLFEHSVDAIFLHDADGRIVDANRRACEALGYDSEEIVGKRVWDFGKGVPCDELRERWSEMSPGEIVTFDGIHERADGTRFPVEVRVGTVDLHGGEQYVAIARDVTERRERQRELERKNERLEEFASVVSHDLRNPLNVMSGRLELARETGDEEHLDAIERAIDRMERLIDDLLTLARQGEAIDEPAPVDVADVAERGWERVATRTADLDVEDGVGVVLADEERLVQLFENLFRNAIEHAGDDVTVRIGSLGRDGTDAGFYVADDGPGIASEHYDRVFERGYSEEDEGSGFGLSIVRRIAEAHGWSVALGESEDGGARFEITGVDAG